MHTSIGRVAIQYIGAMALMAVGWLARAPAAAPEPTPKRAGGAALYSDDFEKYPEGKAPEEMLVLNGEVRIHKDGGNKVLRLPEAPVDSHGVLIGPEHAAISAVSARVKAEATGRRTPEFGIGLGGTGGYQLWVMPATSELQIIKGEDVVAAVPFRWASGKWTHLKLRVRHAGTDRWTFEGKAWHEGAQEPRQWLITWTDSEKPPAGRCMLAGAPYSDKPILFDDVVIEGEAGGAPQ